MFPFLRKKKKCYVKFLYFEMLIINELDEKYVNKRIRSNIGRCPRLQAPVVRAHRGERIRAETIQHERREYRERAVNSSDAAERIFARSERRVSHRLAGRPAGRPVGRSVGVADSNGRRSVSRLLRGSYVNMETGSWNPVLDSTYDSNQRG